MTTFESTVKSIPYPQNNVFVKLANLNNLASLQETLAKVDTANPALANVSKDQLEQIKSTLQNLTFTQDSVTLDSPMGKMELAIIEREEPKTIKFEVKQAPFPMNFWIQLIPGKEENTCLMKLTAKAELNIFIKSMVKKPLTQGIEQLAELLSKIPYEVLA